MSANHARRHQTGRAQVADLGRQRTERLLGLIAMRERVAAAASEYEAHNLDGATELLTQQFQIESAIRAIDPRIYERRWSEWVEDDARRVHTTADPLNTCSVCVLIAAIRDGSVQPLPQQAG